MKRIVLSILLALVLLASLSLVPAVLVAEPVYAGTTSWVAETIPGTTGKMIASNTDVSDFATKGSSTIYATDRESDKIYKSTDAGVSWIELTKPTGATEPQFIAVAPDNPSIVAIVADDNEVYVSTDGGTTWDSLGTPQESGGGAAATALYDIDISLTYGAINYVAVAGIEAGPLANVWYYDIGAGAPVWKETSDLAGFRSTTSDRAVAVALSPNFAAEQCMLAITEEDDGGDSTDNVSLEVFSFNTMVWNQFVDVTFPRTIASDDGITGIDSASITLDPNFYLGDAATQIGFVGLTVAGDADAVATSGIYRVGTYSIDYHLTPLKTGVKIHSVAWDWPNLVAGAYDSTTVWRSADASGQVTTFSSSLKRPGGENKVVVAWAGSHFVAGTSGDESAFAVSENNGESFNDISLIDTALTTLEDVAVSVDGSKVYLATDDGADLSLWRQDSSWERVLGVQGNKGFIIRLAPEDSDAVYVAQKGGNTIYYTTTGGDTEWFNRAGPYNIQDMAVESANVSYVAQSGNTTVSKSIDGGLTWGSAKDTGLVNGNIHTIASIGVDKLIVGSDQGYVAYSTDDVSSWISISQQIEIGALLTQVTASGLADGDYIYATSSKVDTKVLRWQIGISTDWEDMTAPTATAYGAYGMVLQDGVLYVANSDVAANSEVLRTPDSTASTVVWSTRASADETFIRPPSALRVSAGSAKLWAIDTTGNKLFSYTEVPPVVTTNDVTAMTANSARLNGNLDDLGTASSVSVSFEWGGTKGGPYPNETAAQTANATGAFSFDLTGLAQNTTYYFRVKAVGDGTSHGNEKSFTTLTPPPPPPEPWYYLQMDLLGTRQSVTTSSSGRLGQTLEATSADGTLTVTIPSGTTARQENGLRLTTLSVTVNEDPPPPPENKNIIGLTYNFEPHGATFDPPITLTFTYDPANIPEGVAEKDLVLAFYDQENGVWVELECTCDPDTNCIIACVSHFTQFAILGKEVILPASFSLSDLTVVPAEVEPGEAVTITIEVANTGGMEGVYTLILEINGVKEATQEVSIAAGDTIKADFKLSREEPDNYAVKVDGIEGSFAVVVPTPLLPPSPSPEPAPAKPAPSASPPSSQLPSAPSPAPPPESESGMNWILIGVLAAIAAALIVYMIYRFANRRD